MTDRLRDARVEAEARLARPARPAYYDMPDAELCQQHFNGGHDALPHPDCPRCKARNV